MISRPIEEIDSLTMVDDSYISLKIAQNIANDKGPFYTTDYTNGFQPLYVFIIAPFYKLFHNDLIKPIYSALIFLLLIDALTLFFLYKLLNLLCKNKFVPYIAALSYAITPLTIRTSLNGLETSLSFFFIVFLFYILYKNKDKSIDVIPKRNLYFFGLILGLSLLARIDNAVLIGAVFFYVVIKQVKKGKGFHTRGYFFAILGVLTIVLPWLLYSYVYTGDIYPISGKAVRHQSIYLVFDNYGKNPYIYILGKFLKQFFKNYFLYLLPILIFLLVLPFFHSSLRKYIAGDEKNLFLTIFIYSIVLVLAYVYYMFTYWCFDRYFFPLILFFSVSLTLLIDFYISSMSKNKGYLLIVVLILFIVIGNVTRPGFSRLFFEKEKEFRGYITIGKWAHEHFKEGTKIGALQTGSIGYFAEDLIVYNLDGVVDKKSYEAIINKRLMDRIKKERIEYLILWDLNLEYLVAVSNHFSVDDIQFIQKIEGANSLDYEWFLYKVNYSD